MEERRTRLQKAALVALAAMAVTFGILLAVSRTQEGVLFEGTLLQVEEQPDGMVCSGSVLGDTVAITVTREEGAVTVEYDIGDWLHDVCRVEYPLEPIQTAHGPVDGIRILKNGEVLFQGGYDPEEEYGLYGQDGAWDPFQAVSVEVYAGAGGAWVNYETTSSSILSFAMGPALAARGSWGLYLVMLFLSVLVALSAAFPRTVFHLRHCCEVQDPEPTDFYRMRQRIGWVVWPVLLSFGYIWALRAIP